MRPVDYLRREHELILEFIEVLDAIDKIIQQKQVIELEDLKSCTVFIREFVDNIHHLKEENIFFPFIAGMPSNTLTLESLFSEHETVRELLVNLEDVTTKEKQPLTQLSQHIRHYSRLMRTHIFKENEGVFRTADEQLSAIENRHIWEKFEQFENDTIGTDSIERYYTLVSDLKKKYVN